MITRLTKGNNWKPQHTIGTRYTSDLAWTMNVGIYFANVDCGSWNVESGLASHATIHGVYLHGSCTVNIAELKIVLRKGQCVEEGTITFKSPSYKACNNVHDIFIQKVN